MTQFLDRILAENLLLARACGQNLAKLSRGQRLAGALGSVSARDIFGATANREFRRNTIANATRLMPTPQGAEECITNCHSLPKRQSHPHLKPGWIIATVACNPEQNRYVMNGDEMSGTWRAK
ncbi:MAG: hypothetical protein DMF45_04335 [Verrucomicrobia bacterium]|nr:MAG: hypothetical protein DMF45_04335 [Verrucomicrobiota bacterium]